jgi:hypothetical protein
LRRNATLTGSYVPDQQRYNAVRDAVLEVVFGMAKTRLQSIHVRKARF